MILVWYDGPADFGRVEMMVTNRGKVQVSYRHHPMVLSEISPWTKQTQLSAGKVARLFALLQDKGVRNANARVSVLMPGQDVVLATLRAAFGKTPPFLEASFIEAPKALIPVLEELRAIYDEIK